MAAPHKFHTDQAANFPVDSWVHTHTHLHIHVYTHTHTDSGICPIPLQGSTGVLPDNGGKPGRCTGTWALLSPRHPTSLPLPPSFPSSPPSPSPLHSPRLNDSLPPPPKLLVQELIPPHDAQTGSGRHILLLSSKTEL